MKLVTTSLMILNCWISFPNLRS